MWAHYSIEYKNKGIKISCSVTKLVRRGCLAFLLFFSFHFVVAQNIYQFIEARGKNISSTAHPSNDFLRGSYSSATQGYTDIIIISRDNLFSREITTKLRLVHGLGNLYFSDVKVLGDNDVTKPFDAFGLEATILAKLIRKVDSKTYSQIRDEIKANFNTDFENWNGKMWALLALNLDYYDYLMQ